MLVRIAIYLAVITTDIVAQETGLATQGTPDVMGIGDSIHDCARGPPGKSLTLLRSNG